VTTATNQGVSPENGRVHELNPDEARAFFDREVQRVLKISGDAFLANWDSGAYDADPDQPDVMYLAMLIPFAR
jgi:hypothetical protein